VSQFLAYGLLTTARVSMNEIPRNSFQHWEPFHVSLGHQKEDSTVSVTKVGSYIGTVGQKVGGGSPAKWTEQSILDGMAELAISQGSGYWTWFHPETAQGLAGMGFKTRKDVQKWFTKETCGPTDNISAMVAGGVHGFSMIWSYDLSAHATKKIHSATLTKAWK
jgi:hypothetical protein